MLLIKKLKNSIYSLSKFNYYLARFQRRNGRVVEGTGLENRRGFTPSVSSNLTSSAIKFRNPATNVAGFRFSALQ